MHNHAIQEGLRALQVSYIVLLVQLLDGTVQRILYLVWAVEMCVRKICPSSDKRNPVMNMWNMNVIQNTVFLLLLGCCSKEPNEVISIVLVISGLWYWQCYTGQIKPLAIMLIEYFIKIFQCEAQFNPGKVKTFPRYYRNIAVKMSGKKIKNSSGREPVFVTHAVGGENPAPSVYRCCEPQQKEYLC